ncbi:MULTISPECIES: DUF427 domain-containing protein [unclassified Methylobacterium]|uniref:DUF427 domain-containing protein n=1 Tax=unclassified Methylobacterium TaxID=2615210 RepID=UPI0006FA8CB5|nr:MULTISPECIES: DUF427 domain-containing protein [unclassified Methylobacterium]KQO53114.1 hypothetical protein ASF08_19510 [Methylobacterium sp. Leaf85]TXN26602.1 DUF427 domain-containing protein [Methylobacterium sp. WL19]
MREPGPDHPITIETSPRRVRVILAGTVIAESGAALVLREAAYGPVYYLPRADARWEHFTPSARRSHCPYKGEASYYTLTVGNTVRADAVWSYEAPFPAVAEIRDHLAFYPDRVDAIEVS